MSSGERCSLLPALATRQAAGLCRRNGLRPVGVRDCMAWPVDVAPEIEVIASTPSGASFLPKRAALGKSQTLGIRLPSIPVSAVKKPTISMESVGLALCGWPGSDEQRSGETNAVKRVVNGVARRTVLENGDTADYPRGTSLPTSGKLQRDFLGSGGNPTSRKLSTGHHNLSPGNARVNMTGRKLELTGEDAQVNKNGRPQIGNINHHSEISQRTVIKQTVGTNDIQVKPDAVHANASSNDNGNATDSRKMTLPTTGKLPLTRKPRVGLLHRVRVSRVPSGNMSDLMAHRFLSDYIERQAEANKRRYLAETERLNAKRRAKLVRSNKTSELRANRPKIAPLPGHQRTLWKMAKFTKKAQPHFTTFRRGQTQSQCGKSAASGSSGAEMSQDGADTLSDGTVTSSLADTSPNAAHLDSALADAELSPE